MNEVRKELGYTPYGGHEASKSTWFKALYRAIEQLEAEKAARAKTLMENAALKAENERLRAALGRIAHGDRWTDPDSPQRIAQDALTALERIDHGDR